MSNRYPDENFKDLTFAQMVHRMALEATKWKEGSPEQTLCLSRHMTLLMEAWHQALMSISPADLGRAAEQLEETP